jgi:hypothetical protein
MDRPGIIQSFMLPTVLNRQVRSDSKPTNLLFQNTNGQWMIKVQRPGLAQPLITARRAGINGFGWTPPPTKVWSSRAGCPAGCFRNFYNQNDTACYGDVRGETPCLPKPGIRYSR